MQRRQTVQKDCILRTVQEQCCHATAEEIVAAVRRQYPSISRATVFRNLKQFAQDGRLVRLAIPDSADRFDAGAAPHPHIYCRVCGRIADAELAPGISEQLLLSEDSARTFVTEGYDLIFYGLCPACQHQDNP